MFLAHCADSSILTASSDLCNAVAKWLFIDSNFCNFHLSLVFIYYFNHVFIAALSIVSDTVSYSEISSCHKFCT